MITSRLAQRQRLAARAVIGRWTTGALARSLHRWVAAATTTAADRTWLLACAGAGPGAAPPPGSPRGDRLAAGKPAAAVRAAVDALVTVVAGVWEKADAAAAAAVAEARSIFRSIDTDGSGTLTGPHDPGPP